MKTIADFMRVKINKGIGQLLYFFRCRAVDWYIHKLLKEQNIKLHDFIEKV